MTPVLIKNLMEKVECLNEDNQMLENKFNASQLELEKFQHQSIYLKEENYNLKEEVDNLKEIIRNANRQRYGQKSERYIDDLENPQLTLFDDIAPGSSTDEIKAAMEDISYQRKKKSRKDDYSKLPRREEIISVPESQRQCGCCGSEKKVIDYKSREKLHHIPEVLEVVTEKREVLGCPNGCEGEMKTADAPKQALENVKATEELLAHIAITKVLDRQPLYHLEKKFDTRLQFQLPRNTMARWMIDMGTVFQPIVNLMRDELLDYDIAWTDATSFQVLKEKDRKAETKSHAYCFRGGSPGKEVCLFEYNGAGHSDYLYQWFEGYQGSIHGDGDLAYLRIENSNNNKIQFSYCHAHARRRFESVAKRSTKATLANEAMRMYQELYSIERQIREDNLNQGQIIERRHKHSKPIMDEFKRWLDFNYPLVLPKSPIGKAMKYALTYWHGLVLFLDDGRLEIDNNSTERMIKIFVMARKNFLFSDTTNGADALGNHFSMVLTAQHHGLDPVQYYVHVLKAIPYCKSFEDYEKLLPWNIKL